MLDFSFQNEYPYNMKTNREGVSNMNTEMYREFYIEFCTESNTTPTDEGFKEFVEWRLRVESLFKNKR